MTAMPSPDRHAEYQQDQAFYDRLVRDGHTPAAIRTLLAQRVRRQLAQEGLSTHEVVVQLYVKMLVMNFTAKTDEDFARLEAMFTEVKQAFARARQKRHR